MNSNLTIFHVSHVLFKCDYFTVISFNVLKITRASRAFNCKNVREIPPATRLPGIANCETLIAIIRIRFQIWEFHLRRISSKLLCEVFLSFLEAGDVLIHVNNFERVLKYTRTCLQHRTSFYRLCLFIGQIFQSIPFSSEWTEWYKWTIFNVTEISLT